MNPLDFGLPSTFRAYRKGQLNTALGIAAAGKRWRLLQASTGSGKTLIAMTTAKLLGGRTLFLTGTRALQDQAVRDFAPQLVLMKGSDNYPCSDRSRRKRTCSLADNDGCVWRRREQSDKSRCPYVIAQDVARNSELVITNYAYWTALAKYNPDALGKFDAVWADEAHQAVDWLTGACVIEVTAQEIDLLGLGWPALDDEAETLAWALRSIEAAKDVYRKAREKGATQQQLSELTALGQRLRELSNAAASISSVEWVGEKAYERGVSVLRFSPVWPGTFSESKLWRGIERIVLSSATLTHEDAKHLGLRRDEYSFHELDAGFDHRRHPLYYQPIARVDKDIGDGEWRLCMNEWDRFAYRRLQRGWRGVVQATSYDYAERFVHDFKYRDQCVLHGRHNSRDVVAAFARGEGPPVLVSPAVKEGHDFDGDKCRWQIILKTPSPNTLSPVVRARCQSDKMYRNHLTGRDLEQRCGRNMRSHTDFGECLIVDEHFGWLRGKPVFTQSFRKTWRVVDRTPEPLEL